MNKFLLLAVIASVLTASHAFTTPQNVAVRSPSRVTFIRHAMSEGEGGSTPAVTTASSDPMEDAMEEMDDATREMMEKQRRSQELREQEVFMKLSTGKHMCSNCDWEYDETKGDSMMIGGMIKPGTKFDELPADWRCPVCRASKDAFNEIVEEIPGFEVNQGYGFGTNSWTSGQKNLAVFGGLGAFFVLFLSGYAMS
mmetsp:Transcript_3198/g.7019  ORF Transcript_3198/g.7019 Transcript_3198/m.7019 type:complete len:197 (-) Transcript_3198:271-861(-)|eukprot:CAMPEP_0201156884 /NCGR_PEP_ID=MMETSP0851-20130426/29596_1 /ASSEMBLY_ACC=CAM_ASM_000631 /TAXON_ID=183588 /ORGANISM="Pseudo-nitzschia fraudulenta, Strain WWA7" /LENGTH=196 /DNA_ID=CAMNT_0047435083 /DNA_START=90 /DNA_END=680 /DNA_ORIENTATION=+